MSSNHVSIDERFDGGELDQSIWFPYYLPHWSSREESRATYTLNGEGLQLSVPPEQARWCADLHQPPLRVSCLQSGSFAGPEGSATGQAAFREGLFVRQSQPPFRGLLPYLGRICVRMRMTLDRQSMAAVWLIGFEDQPQRSGEICVAEIFGNESGNDGALVGMGIHAFRDPHLSEAFLKTPVRIDVGEYHTYAVDWRADSVSFSIDEKPLHRIEQSPHYPMQLMIGVFDFPRPDQRRTFTPVLHVGRVLVEGSRAWPG